jgi:predicted secreted protein
VLSIKAKEDVKRQLGENYDEFMAREGTAPKKENYENFLFDKDGLTFIFGQYQVASSAAGIIYAKILYSDMAEFNSQSEIIKRVTAK